ncbi:heterokaryon incompatibility protein-domain-containing protein [Halenospora varia]|nr:heterokaryon incompatibility protein-domain-containing protein [Halenospora varia]
MGCVPPAGLQENPSDSTLLNQTITALQVTFIELDPILDFCIKSLAFDALVSASALIRVTQTPIFEPSVGIIARCLDKLARSPSQQEKNAPQKYHHKNLNNERREIRLLKIICSTDEASPIQVSLKTVQLLPSTRFVALSYTWGSEYAWGPEDPRTILIDGESFSIRENLWQFLDTLRAGKIDTPEPPRDSDPLESFDQVRQMWTSANDLAIGENGPVFTTAEYFWIDAICINQTNKEEQNYQVNMMGDIFSDAAHVLVWLGPGNDSSDFAMDCIVHANIHANAQNSFPETFRQSRPDAVRDLLNRDYWTRVWIIQELILAQEIIVLCGTRLIHWHLIDVAMTRLPYPSQGNFMLNQVAHSSELRKAGLAQPKQSLTELISLSQSFKCTDLFDRVYGLLGIINQPDDESLQLKADYSLSREDMYFRILKYVKLADTETSNESEYDSFVRALESALNVHMRRDPMTDEGRLILFDRDGRVINLNESKPL